MVEIWLPYGKTETFVSVNDENLSGILKPNDRSGVANVQQIVDSALKASLESESFAKAIDSGKTLSLLMELVNPSAQSFLILSRLLERLKEKGISNDDTRILLTAETAESIRSDKEKSDLWRDTFTNYSVTEHLPSSSECVEVGKTSRGSKVFLNRSWVEADLRVVFSDVGLHSFFGYRGGCSAVLPGIAGAETIRHNHAMLVNSNARMGSIEGNPVYEGIEEASKLAKVDFGLCILTNVNGDVVGAYAGDFAETFRMASKDYGEMCKVPFNHKSEIVIASAGGSSFDMDLYHACTGLEAALRVVKGDGAVILVAECPRGHGNKVFYEWTKNHRDLKEMETEIKKRYVSGAENAYHLLRAREKTRIYLVSVMPDYYASNVFKLRTARTTNSALQTVQRTLGKDSKIAVLPYATMTLPALQENLSSDGT